MVSFYIIECDFDSYPSMHPHYIENINDLQMFIAVKNIKEFDMREFNDKSFKNKLQDILNENSKNEFLVIRIID